MQQHQNADLDFGDSGGGIHENQNEPAIPPLCKSPAENFGEVE
jgi:hypothetical protein